MPGWLPTRGRLPLRCLVVLTLLVVTAACQRKVDQAAWRLSPDSPVQTDDAALVVRIGLALDAAAQAGTDPSISKFHVRAATVVRVGSEDHVVVGGNTEYGLPEAVHGEVSLVNHVIARFGADAARDVGFIAFYTQACGDSRGCGDCRDYMRAATQYESLLWVCGRATDNTIHIRRFADGLMDEAQFPDVEAGRLDLPAADLTRLVEAARAARDGGVMLFTPPESQVGAAVLSWTGRLYRAAGADDAAFHYRYPVGSALQQAASERDYFIRAVLLAGADGEWPRLTYRDRQYGFESSSFGQWAGHPSTQLILTDGRGRFKATTFETALPHAFSVARFNPEAIDRFLRRQGATPAPR